MPMLERVRSRLKDSKLLLGIVVGAVSLLFTLSIFFDVSFPFFETKGLIYVDSPEVYTRERLVNDRYDQDHWLHKQLERLDDPATNIVTGYETRRLKAEFGGSPEAKQEDVSDTPGHPPEKDEIPEVPFDQEFKIKAAIRDTIRQLVLENLLDDRHDLTGNSVYGLKFDTSVIPGANTHARPFVRIRLTHERPYAVSDEDKLQSKIADVPDFVYAYYRPDVAISDKSHPLYRPRKLYENWLNNIRFRLNNYRAEEWVAKPYTGDEKRVEGAETESAGTEPDCDDLCRMLRFSNKALEIVLGIDPRQVRYDERVKASAIFEAGREQQIAIPKPWSDFLVISFQVVKEAGRNEPRLWFNVQPKKDTLYFIEPRERQDSAEEQPDLFSLFRSGDSAETRSEKKDAGLECYPKDYYVVPPPVGNEVPIYILDPLAMSGTSLGGQELEPSFEVNDQIVSVLHKLGLGFPPWQAKGCKRSVKERKGKKCQADDECEPELAGYVFPSGFFNFLDRVSKTDAYSYAVFPKNDVVGILNSSLFASRLRYALPWIGGDTDTRVSVVRALQESTTSPSLVGFGAGRDMARGDEKEQVEFGWVLSGRDNMEPLQKTELALVSVPAWTTKLQVSVETGWLDREARLDTDGMSETTMEVQLPPDYEALDSLVGGNEVLRRPKILDDDMGEDIVLEACRKDVEILIPGTRLWRSSAVTLGSQKADRITVLPNMGGIIAHFVEIRVPSVGKASLSDGQPDPSGSYAKAGSKTDSRYVTLRVWTSEGVDTAENAVMIVVPPKVGAGCSKNGDDKTRAKRQ